jgi:hypothetical protein
MAADAAGVFADFLSLTITLYKNFSTRQTAHATLQNHIRNFVFYQHMVVDRLKAVINEPVPNASALLQRRLIQLQDRAAWVLEQDENLRKWLDDAGFRKTKLKAGVYRVRHRSQPSTITVQRKPARQGPLKFPRFGVTSKETSFDSLFEKLKEAFGKFEEMKSEWDQVSH